MADGFWGDPDFGGAFFKFDEDGKEIAGIIIGRDKMHFPAKDDQAESWAPVLKLRLKNGDETDVTLSNVDLKVQTIKFAPEIGDWWRGKRLRKVGNKVLFDVEVRRDPNKTTTKFQETEEDAPF